MHQQGKLVGVAITFEQNKPIFSMLMPRTKWKNLDKSSFLVFSIFSSLVGFGSRQTNILHQYISSFRWLTSISSFSLQFVGCWSFVFGGEIWHFKKRTWRNLTEAPRIILTTEDRWSVPSSMSQTSLQTEEALTVKEYKHKQTFSFRKSILTQTLLSTSGKLKSDLYKYAVIIVVLFYLFLCYRNSF